MSKATAAYQAETPVTTAHRSARVGGPYRVIAGKLTRFLARNVRTKTQVMRNPRPLVSFTFDDVAASACTAGAALLERHGARGTFFISGGNCGRASPTGPLATVDLIKALHHGGHEIGCHTYSHTRVAALGRDALMSDLERNRRFMQGILGDIALRNFAYPYGDISFRAKRYLGAHFDSCRSHTPGVNAGTADLSVLKSCPLEHVSIDRQRIADVVAETVRRNGWLLFAGHDVADAPSQYGVQPELLEFALRQALAAGCELVTVSQALQIVRGAAPNGHDARNLAN
jgi:peptidoglycan/xylan/chitin deacetylase (PgdA/CDA1 family)